MARITSDCCLDLQTNRNELCICKRKLEERELKAAWDKGGSAKLGVIVIKTADAKTIEDEMNLHSLSLKQSGLEKQVSQSSRQMWTVLR